MKIDLSHLNLVEKFIVEHGSATVMGVHINFLREQLSAFDRETTNLKAEVTQLKEANKALTAQLQQRAAENHRLQVAAEQQRTARRSETDEKILLQLTNNQRKTSREIAAALSISQDRAESYLSALMDDGLAYLSVGTSYAFGPSTPSVWYLGTDGQHYLVQHELV